MPEELQDLVCDEKEQENRHVNLSQLVIPEKSVAGSLEYNSDSYVEDLNVPEEKRKWNKAARWVPKSENRDEYNSSEYEKFLHSLEEKYAREDNNTEVFNNDLDDLWDLYMANKTLPPGFPLSYSPRFMNEGYRRYSLSFNNTPYTRTPYWILQPLTGDQEIKYQKAIERIRKFNISKNDPKRVKEINDFMERGMRGKISNSSKFKNIVRHFIELRRTIGDQLDWEKPTISVSKELDKMGVPDTQELLAKCLEGTQDPGDSISPADESLLYRTMIEKDTRTTEKITKARLTKFPMSTVASTQTRKRKPGFQFFTGFNGPFKTPNILLDDFVVDSVMATANTSSAKLSVDTTTITSNAPNVHEQDVPLAHEVQDTTCNQQNATEKPWPRPNPLLKTPTAQFLHRHKNKFLVGGVACLVLAKLLSLTNR